MAGVEGVSRRAFGPTVFSLGFWLERCFGPAFLVGDAPFDRGPLDGVCGLISGLFLGSEARGLVFGGSAIFAGFAGMETACFEDVLFEGWATRSRKDSIASTSCCDCRSMISGNDSIDLRIPSSRSESFSNLSLSSSCDLATRSNPPSSAGPTDVVGWLVGK